MKRLRGQFQLPLPDGTDLDVLLNMYGLGLYCEANGIDLEDLEKNLAESPLTTVPKLLWHGVRAFADLNDSEPPLTERRLAALIGSCDWEEIMRYVNDSMSLEDPEEKKPKPRRKASR